MSCNIRSESNMNFASFTQEINKDHSSSGDQPKLSYFLPNISVCLLASDPLWLVVHPVVAGTEPVNSSMNKHRSSEDQGQMDPHSDLDNSKHMGDKGR